MTLDRLQLKEMFQNAEKVAEMINDLVENINKGSVTQYMARWDLTQEEYIYLSAIATPAIKYRGLYQSEHVKYDALVDKVEKLKAKYAKTKKETA